MYTLKWKDVYSTLASKKKIKKQHAECDPSYIIFKNYIYLHMSKKIRRNTEQVLNNSYFQGSWTPHLLLYMSILIWICQYFEFCCVKMNNEYSSILKKEKGIYSKKSNKFSELILTVLKILFLQFQIMKYFKHTGK